MNSFFEPPAPAKNSLNELINLIYQAALQPQLWKEVLEMIRILCNADQCTLFFYNAQVKQHNFATAARADEHALTIYLNNFIALQATQLNHQLKDLPEGLAVTDHDIQHFIGGSYSSIVGQEYMQKIWPNLTFQAGVVLSREEQSCSGLGLQNFTNSPPLTTDNLLLLQKIVPHLQQAISLRKSLSPLIQTKISLSTLMDSINIGIVVFDSRHNIQFINKQAHETFKKIQSTSTKINNQHCIDDILFESLKRLLNHQNCNKIINTLQFINLDYSDGHLKLNGFVLDGDDITRNSTAVKKTKTTPSSYLITIQDSNQTCNLPLQYLQSAYAITAAEGELLMELVNGTKMQDHAESKNIKASTVRWHLKNIMQKTETHSQTELARLMFSLSEI